MRIHSPVVVLKLSSSPLQRSSMSAEDSLVKKTESLSIGSSIPNVSGNTNSNSANGNGLSASVLLRNLKQGAESEEENRKKKVKGGSKTEKNARGAGGNRGLTKKGILEIDLRLSGGFRSEEDISHWTTDTSCKHSSSSLDRDVLHDYKPQTGVLVAGAHGNMRMLESGGSSKSFDSYLSGPSPGSECDNLKRECLVGIGESHKSVTGASNQSADNPSSKCTMSAEYETSCNTPFPQEGEVSVEQGSITNPTFHNPPALPAKPFIFNPVDESVEMNNSRQPLTLLPRSSTQAMPTTAKKISEADIRCQSLSSGSLEEMQHCFLTQEELSPIHCVSPSLDATTCSSSAKFQDSKFHDLTNQGQHISRTGRKNPQRKRSQSQPMIANIGE